MIKKTINNKINHHWTILCGSSSVDQQTNNISLFNLIEQLSLNIKREDWEKARSEGKKGFLAQKQFEIITLWEKGELEDEISAEIEIRLVDPKGNVLHKQPYQLSFAKHVKRHRQRLTWSGIKLTQAGVYIFSINIKYPNSDQFEEVGMVELAVNIKIT